MAKRAVLPLVVALAFILAACGGPEPTDMPGPAGTPTSPSLTPTTEAAPGVAGVTEATVTIANMAFQPHTLIVATGATVTWQNDDVAHTVTSGRGWFDSGQLAPGDSFVQVFDQRLQKCPFQDGKTTCAKCPASNSPFYPPCPLYRLMRMSLGPGIMGSTHSRGI